jgi:hypothetical protein
VRHLLRNATDFLNNKKYIAVIKINKPVNITGSFLSYSLGMGFFIIVQIIKNIIAPNNKYAHGFLYMALLFSQHNKISGMETNDKKKTSYKAPIKNMPKTAVMLKSKL